MGGGEEGGHWPLPLRDYGNILNAGIILALVTIGIVVHCAEYPLLIINVPLCPRIACDKFGAALFAYHSNLSYFPVGAHSRMMA